MTYNKSTDNFKKLSTGYQLNTYKISYAFSLLINNQLKTIRIFVLFF